jgi:hypothetical protein
LTLYLVVSPSLADQTKKTKRKKSNKITQSERKARVFAMTAAHLELLHPSNPNLS